MLWMRRFLLQANQSEAAGCFWVHDRIGVKAPIQGRFMDEPQPQPNEEDDPIKLLEQAVDLADIAEFQYCTYNGANFLRNASRYLFQNKSYSRAADGICKASICLLLSESKKNPYPLNAPQIFAETALEVFRTIHETGLLVEKANTKDSPDKSIAENMGFAFEALDKLPHVSMETRQAMAELWTRGANDLGAAREDRVAEIAESICDGNNPASPLVRAARNWQEVHICGVFDPAAITMNIQ